MKKLLKYSLTLLSCLFLASCGGQNLTDEIPKGEGSIPIGCASNELLNGGRVTIIRSDGTRFETELVDGIIYSNPLPQGQTRIELYPNNKKFNRQSVTFIAGLEQRFVTRMWPLQTNMFINVFDINLLLTEGQIIHVGDTVDLGIAVKALASVFYKPTITVSGGVGMLTPTDSLVATAPGPGLLTVTVAGRTKVVHFVVQ